MSAVNIVLPVMFTVLLVVGCSKKVPVIGISPTNLELGNSGQRFLGSIVDSLGGIAKYIPLTTDSIAIDSLMKGIDGIIFLGGEDVNPEWYGEKAYPCGSIGWYDQRDTCDILMIRKAIRDNIPMIAICRGCQAMNVALGGGLIQDVPTYHGTNSLPEDITEVIDSVHNRVLSKGIRHAGSRHDLFIEKDSKWLSDIAQGEILDSIVSTHHQAVDPSRLGPGVSVAAYSKDSIVEVIEYKNHTFALGIQGHPERDALTVPRIKRIFEVFINHCR